MDPPFGGTLFSTTLELHPVFESKKKEREREKGEDVPFATCVFFPSSLRPCCGTKLMDVKEGREKVS